MPDKETIARAQKKKREGKAPSTQAGEFVREEIHHLREGKHGAKSTQQAIAIGLSKARRAGVELPPPPKETAGKKPRPAAPKTTAQKSSDQKTGAKKAAAKPRKTSAKRSQAVSRALKREGTTAASTASLSKQAKQQARKRHPAQRSASARKAARAKH